MSNLFNLKGKVALVTGCNKGIGKSMALGLAEAGADIVGVSATLAASGSAAEKEVQALGRTFTAYQADLTSRTSLYEFITRVKARHSTIDILVNNAGMILRQPAAQHSDDVPNRPEETPAAKHETGAHVSAQMLRKCKSVAFFHAI